jgi:DNA-binding CsgD family transcriptional regulator
MISIAIGIRPSQAMFPQPKRQIACRNAVQAVAPPKSAVPTTEVLQLICQELTTNEIGDQLCLSPRTVETYRKNLLEKIGARNTVGIVLFALKHGLVG